MRLHLICHAMKRVSGDNDPTGVLPLIGNAIRRARKSAKMSQEALALRSGIDRSHMGRIERGERNLTILNLARICTALEINPSDLLIGADL